MIGLSRSLENFYLEIIMIDYTDQIAAADKLANCVDKMLREKCTLSELTTCLLEYRTAQALTDEKLSEAFEKLQSQANSLLDYEKKNMYRINTGEQLGFSEIAKSSTKKERS